MGPCLCGDPYCGSCGNPELALYEDAEIAIGEKLSELKAPLEFYTWLLESIPALLQMHSSIEKRAIDVYRANQDHFDV